MTIFDLEDQQNVTLDVILHHSTIELPLKVIMHRPSDILISPYYHNGVLLDFSASKLSQLSFHLHCVEPMTGKRVSWRSISVQTVHVGSNVYYSVSSADHHCQATSSERRETDRMPLSCVGRILPNDTINESLVQMNDISDQGVSFLVAKPIPNLVTNVTMVKFDDSLNGRDYVISLKCKVVRELHRDDGYYLYGCQILEGNPDLLPYLLIRKVIINAEKKKELKMKRAAEKENADN